MNKMGLDENVKAVIYAMVKADGKFWFPYKSAIYSYDESDMKVVKEYEFELPKASQSLFYDIVNIGKKLVLSPFCTKYIAVYDMETRHMDFLDVGGNDQHTWYRNIVVYKEKLFVLPGGPDSDVLVVDGLRDVRRIHIDNWADSVKKNQCTSEHVIQDKYLWATAYYSDQVLKLNMETEKYELIRVGKGSAGYTGIAIDDSYIWLAESSTGAVIRYNVNNKDIKKICMPIELDYNSTNKNYVHLNLFDFDQYIISIPALCNKMIRIRKETLDSEFIEIDFFNAVLRNKFNYRYGNYTSSNFGKKINETTLWVQRTYDGQIANINIEDFTYKAFDLTLTEITYGEMYRQLYNSGNINGESEETSLHSFVFSLKETESNKTENAISTGMEIWRKIV